MIRKPAKPKIMRDIDAALKKALVEVDGVHSFMNTGVDLGRMKVVTYITVTPVQQRALGRWWARQCKWAKEAGK